MTDTSLRIVARSRRLAVPFVLLSSLATLRAQCATQWTHGDAIAGVDGPVRVSTTWDPDGAGPLPARLVIGGTFSAVGAVAARNIAAWDPATGDWSALGDGTDGLVAALAVHPSGDLIAAGSFTSAGAVAAARVARWNGTSWSALGAGVGGTVNAVTTTPNGDVVAGGEFTVAGGAPANRIARFDGVSWSAMGSGMDNVVHALTTRPSGEVIAGGVFDTAGGVSVKRLASWNGTAWSSVGGGVAYLNGTGGIVGGVLALPNGDLIVTGFFLTAGGVSVGHIARWNGSAWSSLGSGIGGALQGYARSLTRMQSGDIVVAGFESASSSNPGFIVQRWNGTSWSEIGPRAYPAVHTVTTLPSGEVFVGGEFATIGTERFSRMAKWYGSWSGMVGPGPVTDGPVRALARLPNGDIVAGGLFTTIGGVAANRVARWDGASWSPMGSGMNDRVDALKTLANGDLIAGGWFTTAGGGPASRIARWNGSGWSPLGTGTSHPVHAITQMPNGDLVAGGSFSSAGGAPAAFIARWNGAGWSPFGSGTGAVIAFGGTGEARPIRALTVLPNGDLVAGGSFTMLGGVTVNSLARWNGSTWSAIGAAPAAPYAPVWMATTLANGDLLVAGQFAGVGEGLARWNGTSWLQTVQWMSGPVFATAELPNGDLLAGGWFGNIDGTPISRVARWDGAGWSEVDGGTSSNVHALVPVSNGDVVAGGEFARAGAFASAYVARLTTTCPATAAVFGAGCAEANGPDVLAATSLPWVGSTFRATGTGLPTVAIVLTLTSVTPIPQSAVPLTLAFAQAGIGCDVLTAPDVLGALITTNGIAESHLSVPTGSPLIGLPFYHQFVSIEVDPQGVWSSVSATNALQLVAGSF